MIILSCKIVCDFCGREYETRVHGGVGDTLHKLDSTWDLLSEIPDDIHLSTDSKFPHMTFCNQDCVRGKYEQNGLKYDPGIALA